MAIRSLRRTRNDRRRARTRAALVDAAREVFAARGVEAATIQEIADTADVAKGSFYNHFESRADIARAVMAASLEELGSAIDRHIHEREADPARVIAASLLTTLRACIRDPSLGGFVLQAAHLMEIAEGALGARGRRDLRRGLESGRFRFDDLELVVTFVAGGVQGLLRRRLRGELDEAAESGFVALTLRLLGLSAEESDELVAGLDTEPARQAWR